MNWSPNRQEKFKMAYLAENSGVSFQLVIPEPDVTIPDQMILPENMRENVFYDETLLFYLSVKHSYDKEENSQKLLDWINNCLEIHVTCTLVEHSISTDENPKPLNTLTGLNLIQQRPGMMKHHSLQRHSLAHTGSASYGPRSASLLDRSIPTSIAGYNDQQSATSSLSSGGGNTAIPSSLSNRQSRTADTLPKTASFSAIGGSSLMQQQVKGGMQKDLVEELLCSFAFKPKTPNRKNPVFTADKTNILIPLVIRLDISKTKTTRSRFSNLSLVATLSQPTSKHQLDSTFTGQIDGALCDPEDFDGVNAFGQLREDPLFDQVPAYIISNQYKRLTPMPPSVSSRRTIKESVLIIPAFSVSLSTISLASSAKSSSMLCICIQLKDEIRSSNFILDRVLVQMTHATVHVHENQQVKFPLAIAKEDQLYLLYHVNLMEDSSTMSIDEMLATAPNNPRIDSFPSTPFGSNANLNQFTSSTSEISSNLSKKKMNDFRMRLVSITIEYSIDSQHQSEQKKSAICSSWYCKIRTGEDGKLATRLNIPAFHGRRFELGTKQSAKSDAKEAVVEDGLELSFDVSSRVMLRKIFRVQLLIVNRSSKACRLSIIIPQDEVVPELTQLIKREPFPTLHWDVSQILKIYAKQTLDQSSIACLESRMDLSTIPGNGCQLVNLHYIVIKGQIHSLPVIQLLNRDTNTVLHVKSDLQIFVEEF